MKQFIYLDTDIISSIIAQSEQGLVTQMSYENSEDDGDQVEHKTGVTVEANGKGKLFKVLEAEANIEGEYERTHGRSHQNSTKEIIEKVLHDANFAIAYDHIDPYIVKQGNTDYCEEGKYLELYRIFDFIDFDYLRGLFVKEGVVEFLKKKEADQIEATIKEEAGKLNREQQRKTDRNFSKLIKDQIAENDKKYNDVESILAMLSSFLPYKRMLFSGDGYLIPLDDKYFRIDPTHLGFKYGGPMTCVGMVTNIIGEDTAPIGKGNMFETLQFQVNEVLRIMMPTKEKNICVIHPIAIYYGDVRF